MTNVLLPLNVYQHGGNLSFLWMAQVGECLALSLLHTLDMMWSQRTDTAKPNPGVPEESAQLGSRDTWFLLFGLSLAGYPFSLEPEFRFNQGRHFFFFLTCMPTLITW